MNAADLVSELAARTNFSAAIFTVALLMCRVMPVLIFSPFLGGEVVPTEMKMGIGLTLAMVLYPSIAGSVTTIPLSALPYIALMAKEVFIGFSMAFIVNGVFEAARVAGTLADTMAGSNNAQLYVPQLGQQVSLFSNLKVQMAVVLFLTLDGHHLVIQALADSLTTVPLDGFPRFSQGAWTYFDVLIRVFADMLRISMALAAPAVLATFLTDVALGAINRVAPQIQVFFISMSIKPLVGVLITFLVLGALLGRMQDELAIMLRTLRDALRLLA
ncbi:flagellar biosynthetic protein FliR [Myxococcus stipitatus]|uniref:flagellar biosynthetic protein FliR n=1 Tax=Myxococcus stipitatus TaxID=83455 RepID=UPI0031450348